MVIITADDTDVLVLCIAIQNRINTHLYIKCGTITRMRFINVTKKCRSIGEIVYGNLLGLHAYTRCDTVSSFSGLGKLKALELILGYTTFQEVLIDLG